MNTSPYTISEDWSIDLVLELFCMFRGSPESRTRFEWLYLQNPTGAARVWILQDDRGAPIGFTACFPRQMWVGGRPCAALIGGDFSIATAHRTLGPATMLRREAKALVDRGEFDFFYSHPLPAMLSVHRRVGHPQIGHMIRWTLPLRAERILSERLNRRTAALLAPAANLALAVQRWAQHRAGGTQGKGFRVRQVAEFSDEYDALDHALAQSYHVIGCRTARHLGWRFLANPTIDPVVIEARDSTDRLSGYLVLEHGESKTTVHDLAYLPGSGAERALLGNAARRAVDRESRSLDIAVQRGFPGSGALKSLGFWEREQVNPTVSYGGGSFFGKALVEDAANWFMTAGDRDV